MASNLLAKNKLTILYGLSLALLLFLLKWLELKLIIVNNAYEAYMAAIAVFFTALGIWLALKLTKPKTVVIEKQVYVNNGPEFIVNQSEVEKLGLSKRELDVLQLMAEGLSNQEISERLFVSLNTIKTHSAQIFEKIRLGKVRHRFMR